METVKKLSIAIVANNLLFAEMLKKTMEINLNTEVSIQTINSPEIFFKEVESNRITPDVVVLDFNLNKKTGEEQPCKQNIDHIRRTTPEAAIVVIADEGDMEYAAKTLQYGAHEFVLKDKFVFSHISSAVQGCLYPSRS